MFKIVGHWILIKNQYQVRATNGHARSRVFDPALCWTSNTIGLCTGRVECLDNVHGRRWDRNLILLRCFPFLRSDK